MSQVSELFVEHDFLVFSQDDAAVDALDHLSEMDHSAQAVSHQNPALEAHACPASWQAVATQGWNDDEHSQALSLAPSQDYSLLLEGDALLSQDCMECQDLISFGMPSGLEASDPPLFEMDDVLDEIEAKSKSLGDTFGLRTRSRKRSASVGDAGKADTEPSKAQRRSLRSPASRQVEQRRNPLTAESRSTSHTSTSSTTVGRAPRRLCADSRSSSTASSSGALRRSCRACKKVKCNCKAMISKVEKAHDWQWTLATFSSVKMELDTNQPDEVIHCGTTIADQMPVITLKTENIKLESTSNDLATFSSVKMELDANRAEIHCGTTFADQMPTEKIAIKPENIKPESSSNDGNSFSSYLQTPAPMKVKKQTPDIDDHKVKSQTPDTDNDVMQMHIHVSQSTDAWCENERQARARTGQKYWADLLPALRIQWQHSQEQSQDQMMKRIFEEQVEFAENVRIKNQKLCLLLWLHICFNKNIIALPRSLDLGHKDSEGGQFHNVFQPHNMSFFGWYAFKVRDAEKFQNQLTALCGGPDSPEATRNNVLRNASIGQGCSAQNPGKNKTNKGGGFSPFDTAKKSGKWERAKTGEGHFRHDFLSTVCASGTTRFPIVEW